jgi:dipeptidyl aminopeptidase/acylaminoacyl peptidase
VRPLTSGYRAHEPDVSPDGTQVACAVAVGDRSRQLALVSRRGRAPSGAGAGRPGLVYTPAFSPDGRTIAYSRWKPGGYRDIHLYDLASGTDRPLTIDRAMDVDPRFTPDGKYLLWTSDRTGIYDVYAYDLATAQLYQVTNVLSGAFQPVVSNDGRTLVYSGFTNDGFDLYAMPFDPTAFRLAQPFAQRARRRARKPGVKAIRPTPWRANRRRSSRGRPPTSRGSTCTRGPGSSASTRRRSASGRSGFISTTIGDPVGNHSVGATSWFRSRGRSVGGSRLSPTRACSRRSSSACGARASACPA